jgi:alpha-tubulin suppressor-like RCC1 family protein
MSTINVTNLSGRGGASPNLPDGAVITGVVTATSFSGSGANLTGVANTDFVVGTAITMASGDIGNVNINKSAAGAGATLGSYTGVTTYYGDGSSLSGVGETTTIWDYNPDVSDIIVPVTTGIGFTFSTKVIGGSGSATLKIVNAGVAGTTIQSWGISSVTYETSKLTFGTLLSSLSAGETYQIDIPNGFLTKPNGTAYVGTSYTFSALGGDKGQLWSWGYNGVGGQLGDNSIVDKSSPVQVGSLGTWNMTGRNQIWSGSYQGSAIQNTNQLYVWGRNDHGQLGQNNVTYRSSPVQLPGSWSYAQQIVQVSYGVKDDNTMWVWGNGSYGGLGLNQPTNVKISSPTQLPGTTWSKDRRKNHADGTSMACIKTDGTLWTWGQNNDGKLGHDNNVHLSSPTQIPGTTWDQVVTSQNMTGATKSDGTLWTWGQNNDGQLGQNSNVNRSSPIQIPGTTWVNVYASAGTTFYATRNDGTLWAWGKNYSGVLGQNQAEAQLARVSSPVQIPGTNWAASSTANHAKFTGNYVSAAGAIKTDGTLWMWGYGGYGGLGQGNVTQRSSPTQVPGTTWTNVGAYAWGFRAIRN